MIQPLVTVPAKASAPVGWGACLPAAMTIMNFQEEPVEFIG
jgi:hypothetical protein